MPTSTALVLVKSVVRSDPRVVRQIDALVAAGWQVDSVAMGAAPGRVRDHFAMTDQPAWTTGRIGRALMFAALPNRVKYRLLVAGRVPREAMRRIARGEYDLIIFNDMDFAPWAGDRSVLTPAARRAHLHLDLHEYFPPHLPPGSRLRIGVDAFHVWSRSFIPDPVFTSRSVVASGIAQAYADELGVPVPGIVRSAPDFVAQEPSPVDEGVVRMIHHGNAKWDRGLKEMVDAVRLLPDRFRITFMLMGSPAIIAQLGDYAADLGDRVRIVPPVPMPEIATAINGFDLEVMFFPPTTENLRWALPNKLFEAVQGRLGLVIGPSPMMTEVIEKYGNGIVAAGWTPADLAAALGELDTDRIRSLKAASHAAAAELNAEHERVEFLRIVGAADAG